jgi:endonuclease-3
LRRAIAHPRCELDHDGPWQLLVATILSAQCTDARVNRATPGLFERFPTPAALGGAALPVVEGLVKSTGFYRNKAKAIVGASRILAEEHGGVVPRTLEALVVLPGVARKTANLVLGTGYGIASGIVVDTHVGRVARRLRLTRSEDPSEVERDLCTLVPRREWIAAGHRLLLHGRYLCTAKKPGCARCPLHELCPSREGPAMGAWTARADAEATMFADRWDPQASDSGTVRA